MISYSYVNGLPTNVPLFDPFNAYESEVDEIMDDLIMAYTEYEQAISDYNLDITFLEAGDDKKAENVSEKHSNVVDKIGKAIIDIGKKALAFINNIISKIQESIFANKSDMQKISAMCKKNPSVADDINEAFKNGNLQVADIKSINELEKAYTDIMKAAKEKDVDPDSLKGKWNAAKKKFSNIGESDIAKGVIGVGMVAGGIITIAKLPDIIVGFSQIKQNIQKAKDEAETVAVNLEKSKLSLKYDQDTYDYRVGKAKSDSIIAKNNAKQSTDTLDDNITKSKSEAIIAKNNAKKSGATLSADISKAKSDARNSALNYEVNTKTAGNTISKAKSDSTIAKNNAKKSGATLSADISKAKSDARNSALNYEVNTKTAGNNIKTSKHNRKAAKNKAKLSKKELNDFHSISDYLTSSYNDYDILEDGYMIESSSASLSQTITMIYSEMCKILTQAAHFNFTNLMKARAIIGKSINAGVEAYNKDPNEKKGLPDRIKNKYGKKDDDDDLD